MTMTHDIPPRPSFSDSWGATYRLVEPGTFEFGNASNDAPRTEKPSQLVDITEPFFLGEHLVTQAQWLDLMGNNPSRFQEGWSSGLRPVDSVSMVDVEAFLDRLNKRDANQAYLGLLGRWRLPSEVEWEYAVKAGTNHRWWFGDRDVELDGHGWHAGNAGGSTREVGLKQANPWGFFDMNGLVNEWCADGWERRFSIPREQRPLPVGPDEIHVVRGGSWFTESDATRNTARQPAHKSKQSDGLGFRLVWEPMQGK
jgi:formylglycine-generating enzyme required for sulfatase activity